MAKRIFKSPYARTAAGFAALTVLLALATRCSQAPLITYQANRLVFSELFSTTE